METIKISNGIYQNLPFHQWRIDWSRKRLGYRDRLLLKLPPPPQHGIFRVRVLYSKEIEEIQILPYTPKKFQTFSLAYDDHIDYSLKFANREAIEKLQKKYLNGKDDILIVQKGLIRDSSIANIAFWNGESWITPKTPLLKGTTRERLLRAGELVEKDIGVDEVEQFQKMALMNALLGFYEIPRFRIV